MRTSRSSLLVAAFFLTVFAGCHSCDPVPVDPSLGSLAVLYPDPVDSKLEISSEITDNKATYNLGSVFMGQSKTHGIKVQNVGSGALTLATLEVVEGGEYIAIGAQQSANPVFQFDFAQDTSLGAAEGYLLNVTFQPERLEQKQKDYHVVVALTATNTAAEHSRVEITLDAKGISGVCEIPSPIDFGAVQRQDIGTFVVQLSNPTEVETSAFVGEIFGSDAQTFTFSSDSPKGTLALPPNSTRNVTINFAPTETRPYFAFVKMRAAAGCPEVTVTLQGSGVDQCLVAYWVKPDGSHEPSTVDFGYATPGIEVKRDVTFENFCKTAAHLSALRWSTAEFKVIGEPGAADPTKLLVPAATDTAAGIKALPVAFKGALLGPRTATLSWTSSLTKQPTGTFKGKAFSGGPDIQTTPASTLAFGKVHFFPSATNGVPTKRRITIQNVGTVPVPADVNGNLHVSIAPVQPGTNTPDISEINVDFQSYDSMNGLIAEPGKNTAFLEVTVTPKSLGLKEWIVTIQSNDPDEAEVKITVTADVQIGEECNLDVSPGNVNFGVVSAPGYRDATVNIRNVGSTTKCQINNLDLKAGSDSSFELPGGPIDLRELSPGEVLSVIVRAYPKIAGSSTPAPVTGAIEFFYNSSITPSRQVPLSATIMQGCLIVQPSDVDFGTVQRGCASATRTVTMYNSCSTPVTISSITMLNGAGFPAGTPGTCPGTSPCAEFFHSSSTSLPVTLNPGSSPLTFTARYLPLDLGSDQGTVAVNVNLGTGTVAYIVNLLGRGDTVGQNTDIFNQDLKPKADILMAIDDSGSMGPYQAQMAQNFQSFIQYAQAANVDYNLAVVTTDQTGHTNPNHTFGVFVSDSAHPEKILTPNTPSVEQKFAAKVSVGTNGDPEESCLAPLLAALTPPLVNNENAGFLRPDAKLALVCISDEPDQSTQSALYYLTAFQALKGSKAANMMTFSAIAGFGNTSCGATTENGKYAYLVNSTSGVKDDICTPNWGVTLQQLGKIGFGFRTDFYLNATPDLTGGKTIDVRIDGQLISPTDSRGAAVWHYDPVLNAVIFEPSYVPEAGQQMTITYFQSCYAP